MPRKSSAPRNFTPETAQNFTADFLSWGKINRGTLEMNPDYAEKDIIDILNEVDLGFQVGRVQNYFHSPVTGELLPSQSHSIIRLDNDKELGYGMTDRYNPMSYVDMLGNYFGDFKKLGGIPTRAVSFDGGEKADIQFIFPEKFYKVADREHGLFFNFYSSQDGTVPILINSSDVCIVCGNTHAMSKNDARLRHSIRHTASASNRLMELQKTLMSFDSPVNEYYGLLATMPRYSADVKVGDKNLQEAFIYAMFPDKEVEEGEVNKNKSRDNQRENLRVAIGTSTAERNTSDVTIYDVFQGLTRYTSYRSQNRNESEQLAYVMDGPGANLNAAGFNWLKEYMQENTPKLQVLVP